MKYIKNSSPHDECTNLALACSKGDIKLATKLLKKGKNVNKRYEILSIEFYPIEFVFHNRDIEIFKLLIRYGDIIHLNSLSLLKSQGMLKYCKNWGIWI